MADDQHRAVIVADHFLQQIERFEVEIVGRLVEDEEVRVAGELAREQQAGAFTARQRSDLGLGEARIEQEFPEIAVDVLLGAEHVDPVAAVGQHLAHRLLRRHQLALLIDDDAVERLGEFYGAAVGGKLAGEETQQRGLARAIAPDDADAVATRHPEGEIADDRAAVIFLGDMLGIDDDLGLVVVMPHGERGGALRADHCGAGGAHFLQFGKAALVAAAAAGDTAQQPVFLKLELRVEPFGGALLLCIDLLGPSIEAAEADLRTAQVAAIEPEGLLGEAREEGPVVADHDEGAAVTAEPFLQPFDRADVEMVGRLVEQEHVRVLCQCTDDGGAAALAA